MNYDRQFYCCLYFALEYMVVCQSAKSLYILYYVLCKYINEESMLFKQRCEIKWDVYCYNNFYEDWFSNNIL